MNQDSHRVRSFIADTLALFVFFTVIGVLNERLIVGMTWEQVLYARLIGTAIMLPSGRLYGLWRDFVMRRAKHDALSQSLWDSVALLSFQTPVYGTIIFLSGARDFELLYGTIAAAAMMLALGRPYGIFLASVRRAFRLPEIAG